MFLLLLTLCFSEAHSLCGSYIHWSHSVNIEDVYGLWYGVTYARHTDVTSKEVRCVTLFIADTSGEFNGEWLDWSVTRLNYTDEDWRGYPSNTWSDTVGSWLGLRPKRAVRNTQPKRRAKRNMYHERRLRIVWDEDGQTMEQNYVYAADVAGLWTVDQRRPLEQEMTPRGIDIRYPNESPRHPDVIRVVKSTPDTLIINHCSDIGDGSIISLVLRRSPATIDMFEWYELEKLLRTFNLPMVTRRTAVCAGCVMKTPIKFIVTCIAVLRLFRSKN